MTHANSASRFISSLRVAAVLAIAGAIALGLAGAARAQDDPVEEARRQLLAGSYESALPAATRAITQFESRAAGEPAARASLGAAYELRARARFGLADVPGASSDLEALLKLTPDHALSPDLNPRFVRLFDTARQTVTAEITLAASPEGTVLLFDGVSMEGRTFPMRVAAGSHTLSASRTGFKPSARTIHVEPGTKQDVTLTLEREFATATFVTSPADVELLIDGVSRGRTKPSDGAPAAIEAAARLGVPPASLSAPLVVADLKAATYSVELRKPCHVSVTRPLPITTLTDLVIDPVRLQPSVGTVTIEGMPANAAVYVDQVRRGAAAVLSDVCAGDRTVEVRSPQARFVQRLRVEADQRSKIRPQLKPAFALLSSAGGEGVRRGDVRPRVEEQLQSAAALTIYAPPLARAEELLKKRDLPADWLDFTRTKQALGGAATIGTDTRREYGADLADQLEAQGIAAITILSAAAGSPEVRLSLLARGSSVPDVLEVKLMEPASILSTLEALNVTLPLHSAWAGFLAIDILDGPAPGPVVARVTPGTQAATAGLEPGDVILRVNGQPAANAAALTAAMDAALPTQKISVDVRGRAGAAKRADLALVRAPRAITPDDQSVLFNTLLANLRHRLASATSIEDQAVLRLNIGIALMALENWSDALASFEGVRLGTGAGVADGTLQYIAASASAGWASSRRHRRRGRPRRTRTRG